MLRFPPSSQAFQPGPVFLPLRAQRGAWRKAAMSCIPPVGAGARHSATLLPILLLPAARDAGIAGALAMVVPAERAAMS